MRKIRTTLTFGFFTIMLLTFTTASLFAQGTVEGKVTDQNGDPLLAANVLLKGTTYGAATNIDGNYTIKSVPAGDYTLRVSMVGFSPQEFSITIVDGETSEQNAILGEDILNMESVVITGTSNPKTKLQSSVAITTMAAQQIESYAPRNTADLLKAVPGFYVESSGGEGGNNLFARGIPADGSFRYVSMQEDGLPLFTSPEMMFLNIDLLMRVDETIDRMESVRGGSGSIYASNAAGGIINFISKKGGPDFQGSTKFSVGDYGFFRTDVEFGGPISDNLRYHIGGFYRSDDGIRDPGFRANDGGQIKASLSYLMDRGHIRVKAHFLNDKNIFYLPVPLRGLDEELSGFDANYGTMTSADFRLLSVPKPTGGVQEESLDDGMHPKYFSFSGEISYDIGDQWIVTDKFKKSIIDHQFNAIFSLNDPSTAADYAAGAGITNPVWSYARGSGAGNPLDVNNLNGNGLVTEVGWWAVSMPLEDFINELKLSKSFGSHNLTAGYFFSYDKQRSTWWWHNILTEITDQPRALDLWDDVNSNGVFDEGTDYYVTHDGYAKYGSNYLNYELTNAVNALFFNDEFSLTDELTIDAGLRYEMGTITGWTENTDFYDMGNENTTADDAVLFGNNTYEVWDFEYDELAWSAGLNYAFNNNFALFGRASNGYRAPDDNNLVFDNAANPRIEDIYQYEAGAKYSSPNLAFFVTGFYSLFNDFPFSDEQLLADGTVRPVTRFADSFTIGSEIEIIAKYKGFMVNLIGTVQDPTYQDYTFTVVNDPNDPSTNETIDFDGNQVRRIPQIYFTLTPSYSYEGFAINVGFQYFGERYSDDANSPDAVLPSFFQLNAGASYNYQNVTFAVRGSNLTNEIGLTEGNPRTESIIAGEKAFRMARPILGRSFIFSVQYKF